MDKYPRYIYPTSLSGRSLNLLFWRFEDEINYSIVFTDRETSACVTNKLVVESYLKTGEYIEISAAECALKFGKI
jgi:hypothetical protein